MVHTVSLSLISSSPTSLCSLPSNDSNSDWPSSSLSNPFSSSILKRKNSRVSKFGLKISSKKQQIVLSPDDGSPDQFLENNSIADFMRFIKRGSNEGEEGAGENGISELQTAVVSYRKRFPWSLLQPFLQVDLVSTIHIADKEYFETLQKELDLYDCVLYEMVTSRESLESRRSPSKTKLKSSGFRGINIIGCIQRQLANFLKLDFQLDCLDYEAENWEHADLDFETFKILQPCQREKGESFFTFARDMTIRSTKAMVQTASIPESLGPWRSKLLWVSRFLPMPLVGLVIIGGVCSDLGNQNAEFPELEVFFRLDFGTAMKVFLAKRLTSEFIMVTADVEEKSVIIGERNKAATEALERAIEEGHNKIAILYGGGHMPDLGRRLRTEFDLVPSKVQWVTAWSIKNKNIASNSFPFLKKMAEVSGWPLNRYQTLALLIFSSILAVDLWFWELFFGTTVNWVSNTASEFVDSVNVM